MMVIDGTTTLQLNNSTVHKRIFWKESQQPKNREFVDSQFIIKKSEKTSCGDLLTTKTNNTKPLFYFIENAAFWMQFCVIHSNHINRGINQPKTWHLLYFEQYNENFCFTLDNLTTKLNPLPNLTVL